MKSILSTLKKYHWVFTFISLGLFFMMIGNLYAEGAPSIIDWNPDPVTQGDLVTFSTASSYTSYKWWISDGPGHPCEWQFDTEDSTDSTFTYTFYQSGDWEICLQVPDENEPGENYTDIQTVTVDNHYPQIEDPLWWTATPEPSYVGQSFHVEVPFRDYEDISAYYCTIDYGDGTGAVAGTIQHIWEYEWLCIGPAHTYTTADDFIFVTATIYDDYPGLNSFSTSDIYYHEVIAPAVSLIVNAVDDVVDGDGCNAAHCSLREAVNAAESGDTITFAQNLSGATITLASELILNKDLIIDGSALAEKVTVSGDEQYRVFMINSSGTVTLESLVITDGKPAEAFANGGGIQNHGTLSIRNSSLEENNAFVGGGIYNGGTLSIIDSSLTGNHAPGGSGGAVYNVVGTATLSGCTLSGNTATSGGAIGNGWSGTVIVRDSTLSGNTAAWFGGGINSEDPTSSTQVVSSTLVNNTALAGGGGISNSGTLSVVNSTFTTNTVINNTGRGNAILNSGGNLTLYNSTLSGNKGYITLAQQSADGIIPTIHYANTIIANTVGGWDCSVWPGNLGTNINNWVGDGDPGCQAIFQGDPKLAPLADKGGPTWTMALMPGSPAINTGDNDICDGVLVDGVDQRGALRDVGPSCDIGAYEYGGLVTMPPPKTLVVNATDDEVDGICDISHCSLREAVLSANSGDTIEFDFGEAPATILLGGRIQIDKDLTIVGPGAHSLTIRGTSVSQSNGGIFFLRSNEFIDNARAPISVNISGVTIKDGLAGNGGGIYNDWNSTLIMEDCVIGPNNIATDMGGGIYNRLGEVTLIRCTVKGNRSQLSGGGGIFAYGPATTLINSTVTNNVSDSEGGGIMAHFESTVNLIHSTVTGNTANDNETSWGTGGGVFISDWSETIDPGMVNIQNSIVAGNTDKSSGNIRPDVSGNFTSLGGNLIGDGTGSTGWIGDDLVGTSATPINPLLGILSLNDPGTTPTHVLLSGSPAIDAVECAEGVTEDQRGVLRPQGSACDIGAFELESTTSYGELKISKVFNPLTSGFEDDFTIHYNCGEGFTSMVALGAGESQTISGILIGTECTVTEPTLPTAPAGWTFGIPIFNPADGTVTIGETTVEVTVTNTIATSIYRFFLPLIMIGGSP